ncbi:MAG TPA: YncE family protein [Vicinamibacterales bacterium]|jgi:YVTN family beta-propeller protein|nr:YncE family protein [Vicinamibacterales bacterium]
MRRSLVLVAIFAAAVILDAAQPRSGALLVLNKDDATLAIVDPATGAIRGTVPVGQAPHELVTSDDGTWAFASNYGTGPAPGHTISMIDVAAKKELRRIDVSPLQRPHGLAFAGGKLYFTAEANKTIARYDPATNQIDWTFETGQNTTHMVRIAKDLKTIFTANIGSDSISAIERDAAGNWRQTVIGVGKGPEGNALTPDGKQLWAANSRDGSVSIVDVASKKVTGTIDIGTKRSNRIAFTRDGKLALVSDDDTGELAVIDVAGRTVTKRIPLGKNAEGIVIAPDGAQAFVAVNGDNVVAVVDLKTWQVTKRIATGKGPDGMAWVQ